MFDKEEENVELQRKADAVGQEFQINAVTDAQLIFCLFSISFLFFLRCTGLCTHNAQKHTRIFLCTTLFRLNRW